MNNERDDVGRGCVNNCDDHVKDNDGNNNAISLLDIRRALHPIYTIMEVMSLDDNVELARDLHGRRYLPGYVGLSNLGGHTDYVNCVVQALSHVRPLRDYFLLACGDDRPEGTKSGGVVIPDYASFSPLAKSFSLLLRNMWSRHRFKCNVDPYEFVQTVMSASNGRYRVTGTGGGGGTGGGEGGGGGTDAGEFLSWLLHQLHVGTTKNAPLPKGGGRKARKRSRTDDDGAARGGGGTTSIINDTFMGRVEVTTIVRRRRRRGEEKAMSMLVVGGDDVATNPNVGSNDVDDENAVVDDEDRYGSDDETTIERNRAKRDAITSLANETIIVEEETVVESNFLHLTLDIPEKPLFKDADGGLVIPQEPLANVLRKFDGVTFGEVLASQQRSRGGVEDDDDDGGGGGGVVSMRRRYRLRRLPKYLVLHLSRFKRNGFTVEKNPTIVMFPVRNFDLSPYVSPEGGRDAVPTREEVERMSVSFEPEQTNLVGNRYVDGDTRTP